MENLAQREYQEQSRARTYPHPYPSGWYAVGRSSEFAPGNSRSVSLCDRRIALYRTDDAARRMVALDGYCPHLGAELGGGRVEGDGIRCPFHQWRFDSCGQVTSIPYSKIAPRSSMKTRCWAVIEAYGMVFVWFGADAASREPFYSLPELEDMNSGELVHRGDSDGGVVTMHLSEIAENGADVQHFHFLHREFMFPFTRRRVPGFDIRHDARFELDPKLPHIAQLYVQSQLCLAGRSLQFARGNTHVRLVGPGSLLMLDFGLANVGRVRLFHTHTPLSPLAQQVRYRWYADRKVPGLLVRYLVGNWLSQVQSDYDIFANKVYVARPMLAPEDGPVLAMRRWFRQFYPAERPAIVAAANQ